MFAQNSNPVSIHERVELPDEQLRALAPSVFAAQPISGVSSRYAFVPTAQLVSRLREAGWLRWPRPSNASSWKSGADSKST